MTDRYQHNPGVCILGNNIKVDLEFGVCHLCGFPNGGSSNGPLCSCIWFDGAKVLKGPVDILQLMARNEDAWRDNHLLSLATLDSIAKVRDIYARSLNTCRCTAPSHGGVECASCGRTKKALMAFDAEIQRRVAPLPPEFGWSRKEADERNAKSMERLHQERVNLAEAAARELFKLGRYSEEQAVLQLVSQVGRLLEEKEKLERQLQHEKDRRVEHGRKNAELNEAKVRAESALLKKEEEELLGRRRQDLTWRSKNGRVLRPEDFDPNHLLNTVRYIERRFENSLSLDGDDGIYTDEYAVEDGLLLVPTRSGPIHEVYPIYPYLLAELRRRGLDPLPTDDRAEAKEFLDTVVDEQDVPDASCRYVATAALDVVSEAFTGQKLYRLRVHRPRAKLSEEIRVNRDVWREVSSRLATGNQVTLRLELL